MRREFSAGAVVYQQINGEPHYVLVQEASGYWGLPKGHIEQNETDKQAALREILEETGLQVQIITGLEEQVQYHIGKNILKQVVYFLAVFDHQNIQFHKGELRNAKLLPFQQAMNKLTYPSVRQVLQKAHTYITTQTPV